MNIQENNILVIEHRVKTLWQGVNSLVTNFYGCLILFLVFSGKALSLDGFVVDWISKNMYFSTYNDKSKRGSITVANLDGAYRKEIYVKNNTKVVAITVSPISGWVLKFL